MKTMSGWQTVAHRMHRSPPRLTTAMPSTHPLHLCQYIAYSQNTQPPNGPNGPNGDCDMRRRHGWDDAMDMDGWMDRKRAWVVV